jgi:hypothetical protein
MEMRYTTSECETYRALQSARPIGKTSSGGYRFYRHVPTHPAAQESELRVGSRVDEYGEPYRNRVSGALADRLTLPGDVLPALGPRTRNLSEERYGVRLHGR